MFTIRFLKQNNLKKIFQNLSCTDDPNDQIKYENQFLVASLAVVIIITGFLIPYITTFWRTPSTLTYLSAIAFIISGEVMFYLVQTNLSEKLIRHLLSIIMVALIALAYYALYEYIHFLFWLIVIIALIPTILNTTRTTMYYLMTITIILSIYTSVSLSGDILNLNTGFYISFIVIVIILLFEVSTLNAFYVYMMHHKYHQIQNIVEQKEEITSLYEEVLASEEELREKNEQLNDYNKEIVKNQEMLSFYANNDLLTKLPSRKRIQDEILHNIQTSSNRFALIYIDLDNFKDTNDTLGHQVGDQLLVAVATRFLSSIRKGDTLGRLGGDEFALIAYDFTSEDDLLLYIEALANNLTYTFMINNYDINISAGFGIAVWPLHAQNSIDLISAADTAMYRAKDKGKNKVILYKDEMKKAVCTRIEMENHLLKALPNNEFFLEYQPIINGIDKSIDGFEVLIRWQSPFYGRVNPLDFIPLAEGLGLIYTIGNWVIEQACKKSIALQSTHQRNIKISVNVSAIQIKKPEFISDVKKIFKKYPVAANSIIFELTESVFIDNLDIARKVIYQLKNLGIAIAIDDFGTGYSSLNYIINLPIDALKIDKSFTQSIEASIKIRNVISGIIGIGHHLQLKVVAEGVETSIEQQHLSECYCDYLQGYYFSKPLPETAMDAFIVSNV